MIEPSDIRASPSEFVIPLSKFAKAVYHTRVSVGMRFRMLFETEESSVRRYIGAYTISWKVSPSTSKLLSCCYSIDKQTNICHYKECLQIVYLVKDISWNFLFFVY